jgi:hypothetical protein
MGQRSISGQSTFEAARAGRARIVPASAGSAADYALGQTEPRWEWSQPLAVSRLRPAETRRWGTTSIPAAETFLGFSRSLPGAPALEPTGALSFDAPVGSSVSSIVYRARSSARPRGTSYCNGITGQAARSERGWRGPLLKVRDRLSAPQHPAYRVLMSEVLNPPLPPRSPR